MKLMIVGEAWGRDEASLQHPFVGSSGVELIKLLGQSGLMKLTRDDQQNITEYYRSGQTGATRNPFFTRCIWEAHPEIKVTNVFNLQPKPTNDVKNLCGKKADGILGMPMLSQGKYVKVEYASELGRLWNEVNRAKPNLILTLGATATWAFCRTTGIDKIRGATIASPFGKVLPTFHPAAMLRDWSLRPIILADFEKALREQEYPEVRRPRREVWIEPSIEDLWRFSEFMAQSPRAAIDIETIGDMITCIGFSPEKDLSLVVPFFDPSKPDKNYWPTFEEEQTAWKIVRAWCTHRGAVFQNGLYDIAFLWRTMRISVPHAEHDTMLLHHALQPEMPKGLAFLGSIYTDEARWKLMRGKNQTVKREE